MYHNIHQVPPSLLHPLSPPCSHWLQNFLQYVNLIQEVTLTTHNSQLTTHNTPHLFNHFPHLLVTGFYPPLPWVVLLHSLF